MQLKTQFDSNIYLGSFVHGIVFLRVAFFRIQSVRKAGSGQISRFVQPRISEWPVVRLGTSTGASPFNQLTGWIFIAFHL